MENTLWIVEEASTVQLLITWAKGSNPVSKSNSNPGHQTVEMWKRSTTVGVQNLVELKDLLQENTEWETSHILSRKIINAPGTWDNTDRDAVLEQGYESSGLPPQACCPRCVNKKPVIVSGIREPTEPSKQDPPLQERYLD